MRRSVHILMVLVLAVVLSACGSDSGSEATPENSTPAPTGTPPPAMVLGPIVWTDTTDEDTGEPGPQLEQFATNSPAIIVVFKAENVPAGTEFVAEWTINEAPIPDATMEVTANGDLPHGWVAFRFTREEGQRYPVGDLAVTITVSNGETMESWTEIVFPND